ncbi:MAG: hypothetical protein LC689_02165 [Myxococcales bacterium]|nr:hypothetical protein [Myxococcales bacterium]
MLLRRASPLAVAIAAIACEPSVPFDATAHNPAYVDYAVFDPAPDPVDNSPADIPLPSDVALQPQALATQSGAQLEVLQSFAAQGGWPADQDLALTFDFVRINIDPKSGQGTRTAPALDLSTINPSTLLILSASSSGVGPVAYDPPKAADYVVNGDHGTLTIHKTADKDGLRHYPPATYIAAVRGGANGVKVQGGGTLNQRPAMYLITQGADLSRPENQGLLPGNTREEKAKNAAQLEDLRKAFLQPFAALQGAGIPTNEIASMAVFTVTPRVRVRADPAEAASTSANASTALPFPSDFLFKPGTNTLLDQLTAPTGPFKALGPGLATLDGFSTTALITASTSSLIDPTTVNKDTVFLYELTATGPKRVPEARELSNTVVPGWAAVSTQLVATGTSATNVIGLQPAIPIPTSATTVFAIPPLKQGTEYAVVITDKVTEPGGTPIVQATLGRLLALNNPLISNGVPTVAGLDAPTATFAEQLRQALKPVLDDVAASKGITREHVVMAYTFRTQGTVDAAHGIDNSYQTTAANLAALPYNPAFPATTALPYGGAGGAPPPTLWCNPGIPATSNPACTGTNLTTTVFSQYGVDPTISGSGSTLAIQDVGYVVESKMVVFNKLRCTTADATANPPKCVDTGAFGGGATATPVTELADVLIAVPLPPYVLAKEGATCVPNPTTPSVCSVPLVIYHHGLGDSRNDMLYVANELNKAGFVVAAIDMNKQGNRSYCSVDTQCASGTCDRTTTADMAKESDPTGATPGICTGGYVRDTSGCPGCDNSKAPVLGYFTDPVHGASANFVLSFNLFRARDTFRQDIIDQSQLIRVLSPDPTCNTATAPPPSGTPGGSCANGFITSLTGVQIDPARIYMLGQSLGGIVTVPDAAANPRVRKVTLNAAGSTIVDVFSNSKKYFPFLDALLATQNADKETHPSGFIQFVTVAKWILDPADPENFAGNLLTNTIPSPLSGGVAPPGRTALSQMSQCDDHVPSTGLISTSPPATFNTQANLTGLILGLPPSTTSGATLFKTTAAADPAFCPAGGEIDHGFLLDWTNNAPAATAAQDDATKFFKDGTLPPATETP